jgi:hypothetical protein
MDNACVVEGCGWYGTANGGPESRCAAQGGFRLCAFEWLEDREAYDDRTTTYSQWVTRKRQSGAPAPA